MRRCFYRRSGARLKPRVFSAYAEVFLPGSHLDALGNGFLRICGGVSPYALVGPYKNKVFSAYAEVFPYGHTTNVLRCRFLRVCGGVSIRRILYGCNALFSPRMRRCFFNKYFLLCAVIVFSAYAEVFLKPY